jgi:hypothetical protein
VASRIENRLLLILNATSVSGSPVNWAAGLHYCSGSSNYALGHDFNADSFETPDPNCSFHEVPISGGSFGTANAVFDSRHSPSPPQRSYTSWLPIDTRRYQFPNLNGYIEHNAIFNGSIF